MKQGQHFGVVINDEHAHRGSRHVHSFCKALTMIASRAARVWSSSRARQLNEEMRRRWVGIDVLPALLCVWVSMGTE